ncbi:hypothetical protein N3K66_002364 [Trichothecium roseum]|uniref:Uncharacterized protein n=1 Tax=Trichothecium roseum TaxID=47278 RepID=A0ACC0V9B7_9HYPO|nr:hypothetical protein N3K66_002364 [Trichothecium roseum]
MFRATPNTPHVFNPVPNSDPATYGFMNSSPFNTSTPMRHPASAHARRPSDVISHDRMYHFGSSQETTPGSHGPSYSFESPVGYIANRRNAANNSHSFPSSQEESPLARLPHHRERRPSFRLSTDLEGRANVINEIPLDRIQVPLPPPLPQSQSHIQPSPVHDSTNSRRSFQRSQSAAASLPPVSSLLRRSLSGRSRDVSNWESCAATQQHDPLIDMAENESTGSAAAAISLIRSTSSTNGGGGVLQPSNGYKHNGRITKPQRPHVGSRKPRLSHTRSDISDILAAAVDSNEKPKEKDVGIVFGTPGTESDKENLSPDEDGNPRFSRRRRPLPAVAAAQSPKRRERSLLDSRNAPNILRAATAPSKYGGLGSKEGTPRIYEDSGNENGKEKGKRSGDELSRMVKEANSPSKRHMLDCVSTLLSLRQGESMR